MRKPIDGEIYNELFGNRKSEIGNSINQQLYNNIGVIAPEHIETALMELKSRAKRSSQYSLLSDAMALYEQRGLIRLFNLSASNGGRSRIPTMIPYIPGIARNRYKEGVAGMNNEGRDYVLYVNLYRIGNWSADESVYSGISAFPDLYTELETGVIGYKLLVQNMADTILSDKTVLEYLVKLYTFMFGMVMQKTKTTFGGGFQNDAANFLISRFFLLYVLQKPDIDTTDDYAYMSVQNRSSMEALKAFEENEKIDYSTLTGFLKTFGQAFYNGEEVMLLSFETNWVQLFGDATALAIEYVPYFIHFLFAAFHGARLGGNTKLYNQVERLNKLGLPRLYNAVINALK